MNMFLKLFREEGLKFGRENRWVFAVFFPALALVALTNRGNPLEVAALFSLHFVADVLIMMMFRAYAQGDRRTGTGLQILSTSVFLTLKIYSGLRHGAWQYLSADLLYLLAAFKNYQKDICRRDFPLINTWTGSALAALIIGAIYIPQNLLVSFPQWVQTAGIFLFAIALINANDSKKRTYLSAAGLSGMVLGSAVECGRTLYAGNLDGLALSYFLLPTTVFVFYLKECLRVARPLEIDDLPAATPGLAVATPRRPRLYRKAAHSESA